MPIDTEHGTSREEWEEGGRNSTWSNEVTLPANTGNQTLIDVTLDEQPTELRILLEETTNPPVGVSFTIEAGIGRIQSTTTVPAGTYTFGADHLRVRVNNLQLGPATARGMAWRTS